MFYKIPFDCSWVHLNKTEQLKFFFNITEMESIRIYSMWLLIFALLSGTSFLYSNRNHSIVISLFFIILDPVFKNTFFVLIINNPGENCMLMFYKIPFDCCWVHLNKTEQLKFFFNLIEKESIRILH